MRSATAYMAGFGNFGIIRHVGLCGIVSNGKISYFQMIYAKEKIMGISKTVEMPIEIFICAGCIIYLAKKLSKAIIKCDFTHVSAIYTMFITKSGV